VAVKTKLWEEVATEKFSATRRVFVEVGGRLEIINYSPDRWKRSTTVSKIPIPRIMSTELPGRRGNNKN
jgi:hypothetical protein